VLTLLREGNFAGWPARIEVVDECAAGIEDEADRECYIYVAQAVLMQRLREGGGGENRTLVRTELEAEGVEIGISDGAISRIIAEVQCLFVNV
jgi:hypothetical protein